MKAMRGRIALPKHFRAKSVEASVLFREAFGARTRPRVAFPDGQYFYNGSRQIDNLPSLSSFPTMTLQERVDSDLKAAMRAKDTTKLGVLRMLKSALKYAAIAKSGAEAELNDTEAAQVIRKQARQRQDSIESFEKGGRAELAEKEKEELSILNGYLPQPMNADEISKLVRETIAEAGATSRAQMGAVMKALQAKVAGRVDGKALSAEVQKQLSG
jgi:uncharacterized protein